ncbi:MAG: hypothetical protein IPO92_08650 [Saprospiraceae bacterium]|nr:hypothetical protein [Saprospiraceae bacterium]
MFTSVLHIYKDSFSGLSSSVWLLSLIMLINRTGAMVLTFMSLYLTTGLGFSLRLPVGLWELWHWQYWGFLHGRQLSDKLGYYHIQLYSLLGSAAILLVMIFHKLLCHFM